MNGKYTSHILIGVLIAAVSVLSGYVAASTNIDTKINNRINASQTLIQDQIKASQDAVMKAVEELHKDVRELRAGLKWQK